MLVLVTIYVEQVVTVGMELLLSLLCAFGSHKVVKVPPAEVSTLDPVHNMLW